MDNLRLYNAWRAVPQEAQKPIEAGRLKGKTDISPMWRIKVLTEMFGPVGLGWYYEITDKRIEQGAGDEKAAFVDIALYIKENGEWSKPIVGTGGSGFINLEKETRLYTNDEAFKMALTDAISVSCKALGIAADIYFSKDRTKYSLAEDPQTTQKKAPPKAEPDAEGPPLKCQDCNEEITQAAQTYSTKNFGRPLCRSCQTKEKASK